ncbi:MAG: flagellar basal body-associated FliL family protein [Rubrivivax sp.]|jgi:flagellar FliL protein|nr:flagellar basal body-associated FliL family protein [Rubrivivax sp.]
MSAAKAADPKAAPKGGKKRLLIVIGAVVLVLLLGGGAAVFMMMKSKAAAEAAAAEEEAGGKPAKKEATAATAPVRDPKTTPTFVPLDPFTVNLADRDAERYAQIGVALEIDDPKQADVIKAFMPVIRNNILLLLSHKTAAELMDHAGKVKLAEEIQEEASRALGVKVEEQDDGKTKKTRKRSPVGLPITAVHFSNFIIQ